MQHIIKANIIDRVLYQGVIAGSVISILMFFVGPKMALGVVVAALLALASLKLYRLFVPWVLKKDNPPIWFWFSWFVKLPIIFIVLYFAISKELVNPIGFCIGTGIVPVLFLINALLIRNEYQ